MGATKSLERPTLVWKFESGFWKDYSLTENKEILKVFREEKSFIFGFGFFNAFWILVFVNVSRQWNKHAGPQ